MLNSSNLSHNNLMKTHQFIKEVVGHLATAILKVDTKLAINKNISSSDLKEDLAECKDLVETLFETVNDEKHMEGRK